MHSITFRQIYIQQFLVTYAKASYSFCSKACARQKQNKTKQKQKQSTFSYKKMEILKLINKYDSSCK